MSAVSRPEYPVEFHVKNKLIRLRILPFAGRNVEGLQDPKRRRDQQALAIGMESLCLDTEFLPDDLAGIAFTN